MAVVVLREMRDGDLGVFWEQLSDPGLQWMAAITRAYHYDRGRFDEHWAKVRNDPAVTLRTVLADDVVVGHAAVYGPPDEREVTYVIGPAHWGRGLATQALTELLRLEATRPLYAAAVADNAGSIRVLEKCGFTVTGRTREFARARDEEVDLVLLSLLS
ncbi:MULTISPECIES: GNAT family N-acetyltransferase [unclassified Streptomyces]|uniref:GNAT family N-acetyltransferase n=1 Tax=unclassified Streptomyces TaxID=2593676 RepID=UPI001BE5A1E6|nr:MULTISPECIES: GNAT family N-acetyltransferase [unclassified Streptomyces]MBT2407137.1 GNAT family N-acetyltransferase [Streptomyces sp. ISL-21]MBT2457782.1 GNAT family N-acetyltransferase [Streptomyces sp. ISL-86]MBT2612785.1 GNAT family N-acetyltransferase [Streptomyces sp. ISL-87]